MSSVTFLICTYNYNLSRCLDSVLLQDYDGKIEILLVDAMSDESTLRVLKAYAKKYPNISIITNKKRFPEGYGFGKWLGWKKIKSDFVFILDQDNILDNKDCLREMLKPFQDPRIFGVACRLSVHTSDSLTNQYIALQGTDPFFAYRSLDGIINLRKLKKEKDYLSLDIENDNLIITGGNCFIYRKSYLDKLGGYTQDTENIARLVNSGFNRVAIPTKVSTHHLAIKGFLDFIKKKKKWAKTYSFPKEKKLFSYFPRTRQERKNFIVNLFFISLIFPNILVSFVQILKTRKKAWILHPLLSFITQFTYFIYSFLKI